MTWITVSLFCVPPFLAMMQNNICKHGETMELRVHFLDPDSSLTYILKY